MAIRDTTLNSDQELAVDIAIGSRFSIITGGAGTGKTTLIKSIADRLKSNGASYNICAFAGKAAARLREATGYDASTIHRMLGYNGTVFAAPSMPYTSVIVDESSMVNAGLLAEIIRRDPKRLILVGDQAQLPPVGRGQPFHDLIDLRPDCVTDLKHCYRNSEAVYDAATKIRAGECPQDAIHSENEQWEFVKQNGPEEAHEWIIETVISGAVDFQKDIILVPRNGENDKTPATVKSLNAQIREIINPPIEDDDLVNKFRIGDRVIVTKNFPDSDIWNGTTGTVHDMYGRNPEIRLDIDNAQGSYVKLNAEETKSLQFAYALTVHKSQGSQYRNVYFLCLNRDLFTLLDRSLIYTAVTRAQSGCYVIGQKSALRSGISQAVGKKTILQVIANESIR